MNNLSNDLNAYLMKEYGGGAIVLLVGVFFILSHCCGDGKQDAHNGPKDKAKAAQSRAVTHRHHDGLAGR